MFEGPTAPLSVTSTEGVGTSPGGRGTFPGRSGRESAAAHEKTTGETLFDVDTAAVGAHLRFILDEPLAEHLEVFPTASAPQIVEAHYATLPSSLNSFTIQEKERE